METIATIRRSVSSAVSVGRTSYLAERSKAFAVRDALESTGFRFRFDSGRLYARHVGRHNAMPTPADLRVVRLHADAIRLTFAG